MNPGPLVDTSSSENAAAEETASGSVQLENIEDSRSLRETERVVATIDANIVIRRAPESLHYVLMLLYGGLTVAQVAVVIGRNRFKIRHMLDEFARRLHTVKLNGQTG